MQKVGFITTFLHSINVTRESNENGRFSAQFGLVNLMLGREIKNVVFLGITETFGERKHMAFLLLLRPNYMQKWGEFNFSSLTGLYLNFVSICSKTRHFC